MLLVFSYSLSEVAAAALRKNGLEVHHVGTVQIVDKDILLGDWGIGAMGRADYQFSVSDTWSGSARWVSVAKVILEAHAAGI